MRKLALSAVLISLSGIALAQIQLVKKWESDSVFKVPESVLFDPDHNILYVANIDGKQPWEKDGAGSIGRMSTEGQVITAEWITGFNAPKGMGLYHHTLYVADIDRVVVVDLHQGKIFHSIDVPGAKALNDITIDTKGVIYVSDSRGKKVYKITNGKPEVLLDSTSLKGPNGLKILGEVLYILDAGTLYRMNPDRSLSKIVDGMEGGTDGIENISANEFIVSCWSGVVYYVNLDGKKEKLFDTRDQKINSADIGLNPGARTLYVPTFWRNTVVAYEVK